MVDILIGVIPPVRNHQQERDHSRRQPVKKRVIQERRKKQADRRSSIRNGVVVTLSKYPDRRKKTDRRKYVYSPGGC